MTKRMTQLKKDVNTETLVHQWLGWSRAGKLELKRGSGCRRNSMDWNLGVKALSLELFRFAFKSEFCPDWPWDLGQVTQILCAPCCCCRFSRVWLCAAPQTAAHQAPPSLGFSKQEHWSGVPLPSRHLENVRQQIIQWAPIRIKYTRICEAPTAGQGMFSLNGKNEKQGCESLWAKWVGP